MKMPTKAKSKGLDYNHDELYPNHKMLSSSQVLAYEQDPKTFFMEYVLGVRRPCSNAMHIGKVFSAMYADRKWNWRKECQAFDGGKGIRPYRIYDALEQAISQFPDIGKRNCEVALKCKYKGWKFRATLDGYYGKTVDIENKTGQVPWYQNEEDKIAKGDTSPNFRCNFADTSIQVTFQYWIKWKKDKELFDHCQLNWVDLRANAPQLVNTFVTYRTLFEIQEFEKRIDRVIAGIEVEQWE